MTAETTSYPGAGAPEIQFQYDIGNDFFFLWLGEAYTYSCALWDSADDTLAAAQRRKLDYLIEGCRAQGARCVLDVGCGYGSALRRLVDQWDVDRAVGLTLSQDQADYIASWDDPRCEARLEAWTDHEPEQPYGAIISIGAMEHFVRLGADPAARAAAYREFFERCREWLVPGGRLAVQTMSKGEVPLDRRGRRDLRFALTQALPGTDAPALAELATASSGLFQLVSLRNDRKHYARTIMEWYAGIERHRDRAVEAAGEEVVERYERLFPATARFFAIGNTGLLRAIFAAV